MIKIWDSSLSEIASLSEALNIKKGSIVQVAGSGGKTSVISEIAKENPRLKTAILTTTRRFAPETNCYLINKNETVDINRIKENHVEFGEITDNGKIRWIGNENYKIIKEWADIILIEADGSKRLPIKAAAPYEPVFVDDATHTIVVCGLSAIGKELGEVCHRFNLIEDIFDKKSLVSETIISKLLKDCYFHRLQDTEPVLILNQADNSRLREAGEKILLSGFYGFITKTEN